MKRVVTVAGTRPEAIKVAPVLETLSADPRFDSKLVVTGQHREIMDQVLHAFGLNPDRDLNMVRSGVGLNELVCRSLDGLESTFIELAPDLVMVQGDTTTAFAAALAAFHLGIPVAHLEAGLRTGDMAQPFPEEANRRLISVIASLNLAPTAWARANLEAERVPAPTVVTGNTIVDALNRFISIKAEIRSQSLRAIVEQASHRPVIVVTSHRRENWGAPQERIANALRASATSHPEALFVLPLHPNPQVRASLASLGAEPNIVCTEPMDYHEMVAMMSVATALVTDSGGLQEEGCALGLPVLVLREVTERPEGVYVGLVELAGTDEARITTGIDRLLTRTCDAPASNVFGDGHAAERVRDAIAWTLGLDEFAPKAFTCQALEDHLTTQGGSL